MTPSGMNRDREVVEAPLSTAASLMTVSLFQIAIAGKGARQPLERERAQRQIEVRLRQRHFGGDERVLRLQQIELRGGAGVVLHLDEVERLLRQLHRALGGVERAALGAQLAL